MARDRLVGVRAGAEAGVGVRVRAGVRVRVPMVDGARSPCCSLRMREAALMYLTWCGGGRHGGRAGRCGEHGMVSTLGGRVLTLLLWKPTAWIRPSSVASSVCKVEAGWRQGGGGVEVG